MFDDFRKMISVLLEEYKDSLDVKKTKKTGDEVFRAFVSSIVTQGRTGVETTLQKIERDPKFKRWKPEYFSTESGKRLLRLYIGHQRKVDTIHKESKRMLNSGLKKWIDDLLKDEIDIGLKTKDDFLKEIGFLDHFPIDRYYPPFLARTGLLSQFLSITKTDPGKFMRGLGDPECYESYKSLMIQLCRDSLEGLKYHDLDLSKNPGIVDMIIWRHCARAEEAFNVCGKEPNCLRCKIRDFCRYGSRKQL